MRGHAVPLRGAARVQQEGVVHAVASLDDRVPVEERHRRYERGEHVLRGVEDRRQVDPGPHPERVERRDEHLRRGVAGAGAERAQRPVDPARAGLHGDDRVRDAEAQIHVAVEPDLGVAAELGRERLHPGADAVRQQRAGGVDDVDALASGVRHDARLPRELGGPGAGGEHQEPGGLQAERPRGLEVLDADVRLGRVGRDPEISRAGRGRLPEVPHRAEARQQQRGDPRPLDRRAGDLDEPDVAHRAEAVVERGAGEAVAVADLDDVDARRVERGRDPADLLLGEPVGDGVRAVPQRRVGDADARRGAHAETSSTRRPTGPAAASSSAARFAAAVMMSRLPAHSGR